MIGGILFAAATVNHVASKLIELARIFCDLLALIERAAQQQGRAD